MHPGTLRFNGVAYLAHRIESAGIEIAGLRTDDRRALDRRDPGSLHSTLTVHRDLDSPIAAKAQYSQ